MGTLPGMSCIARIKEKNKKMKKKRKKSPWMYKQTMGIGEVGGRAIVVMRGGGWGLGRCVKRAGLRGQAVERLRLGVRLLSSEGHGCSHDSEWGLGAKGGVLRGQAREGGLIGRLRLGVRLLSSEGHGCSC